MNTLLFILKMVGVIITGYALTAIEMGLFRQWRYLKTMIETPSLIIGGKPEKE